MRENSSRQPLSIDVLTLYKNEVGAIPLLTTEQEIDLFTKIEYGRLAQLQLDSHPSLSYQQQEHFGHSIIIGAEAQNQVIQANTRLVISNAQKYLGRRVPFLDLIQEGNLGLYDAIDHFDYRKGNRFSTYATRWIKRDILLAIAAQGYPYPVPIHMAETITTMYFTINAFFKTNQRRPTIQELASLISKNPKYTREMLRVSTYPVSYESDIVDDDDGFNYARVLPSPLSTESQACQNLALHSFDAILALLTPEELQLLQVKYESPDSIPRINSEVGEILGVSRETVRLKELDILQTLADFSESTFLPDYPLDYES